jgi:hypothetical protein
VCAAQPPGPAPGRAAGIPSADLSHDFEGAKARVGTKQKRQGQFQAVAQRAQIFGAFGDTTDTYREFVVNARTYSQTFQILPDQRQSGIGGEVAGQLFDNKVGHVKLTFRVNGACGPTCLFKWRNQHILTIWSQTQEGVITTKFFNHIEVVLALHQQAQTGLQNVAVGDTTDTYREFVVNASTDSKTFKIFQDIASYLPTNANPALEVR